MPGDTLTIGILNGTPGGSIVRSIHHCLFIVLQKENRAISRTHRCACCLPHTAADKFCIVEEYESYPPFVQLCNRSGGWSGGAMPLPESLLFDPFWRLCRQNGSNRRFCGGRRPPRPRWRRYRLNGYSSFYLISLLGHTSICGNMQRL